MTRSLLFSIYFCTQNWYNEKVKIKKGGEGLKTKKIVLLGLLCAIALTIFMIEAQIPPLVPIPGVKLGLSNIVTVFCVFLIGGKEGAALSLPAISAPFSIPVPAVCVPSARPFC